MLIWKNSLKKKENLKSEISLWCQRFSIGFHWQHSQLRVTLLSATSSYFADLTHLTETRPLFHDEQMSQPIGTGIATNKAPPLFDRRCCEPITKLRDHWRISESTVAEKPILCLRTAGSPLTAAAEHKSLRASSGWLWLRKLWAKSGLWGCSAEWSRAAECRREDELHNRSGPLYCPRFFCHQLWSLILSSLARWTHIPAG